MMSDDRASGDGAIEIAEPLCAVFRRTLKAEGLKYTPERAHVLEIILGLPGPFEVDQVLEAVREGGFRVSKATIYRTIKLLQDAGIIQQVLFDKDQSHYQLIYGRRPNDLLIRVDSGEVISIDVPELIELRDRICAERGLSAQGHRFQIFAVARPEE
jgi:Fur family ferric uptake transcriptional regulator